MRQLIIHLGCQQKPQQHCFSLNLSDKIVCIYKSASISNKSWHNESCFSFVCQQILFWCKIIGAVQHDQLWHCISSSVITFFWNTTALLQHGFPVPEERHKATTPPCYVLWGMLVVSSSYQDDVTVHSSAKHCACVVSTASVQLSWGGLMGNFIITVTLKIITSQNTHYTNCLW